MESMIGVQVTEGHVMKLRVVAQERSRWQRYLQPLRVELQGGPLARQQPPLEKRLSSLCRE